MKLANCFNTQPPEGGWIAYFVSALMVFSFNTQPPEGGWKPVLIVLKNCQVSTHSRPKAAVYGLTQQAVADITVSTHSRPKAAG